MGRTLSRKGGEPSRGRKGLTGLETAIVLIAFVIVAAAFAFAMLNVGFQTTQKSQQVVRAGLEEASSTMELDGAVIAMSDSSGPTAKAKNITFVVKLSAGRYPIDLNQDKLIISWTSENKYLPNIYDGTKATITAIFSSDTDMYLKYGDKYKVFVNLTAIGDELGANKKFKIELKPVVGSVLIIERRLPPAIEEVMFLG
jgi:flagellin FlaB